MHLVRTRLQRPVDRAVLVVARAAAAVAQVHLRASGALVDRIAEPGQLTALVIDCGHSGLAFVVTQLSQTGIIDHSYPLRYRMLLGELHQTWDVEPTAEGSRVTLAFHGAVKLGVLGRLVVRMLMKSNRR